MAKKCKPELSDRCFPTINARCVDYEGDLLATTLLDPDDCNTLEEVIEDIINQVDENTEDLDVTDFGCCMEYEISDPDRGLTVKDVLGAHESLLCDIVKRLDEEEVSENCNDCEDDCGEKSSCCGGLVHKSYGSGEIHINTVNYSTFKELPIADYPNMSYKATKKGTYKFTIDIGSQNGTAGDGFFVGIALNSFDPLPNPFHQSQLVPLTDSKTMHFIIDMIVGDVGIIKFKRIAGNIAVDGMKLIVEKVK